MPVPVPATRCMSTRAAPQQRNPTAVGGDMRPGWGLVSAYQRCKSAQSIPKSIPLTCSPSTSVVTSASAAPRAVLNRRRASRGRRSARSASATSPKQSAVSITIAAPGKRLRRAGTRSSQPARFAVATIERTRPTKGAANALFIICSLPAGAAGSPGHDHASRQLCARCLSGVRAGRACCAATRCGAGTPLSPAHAAARTAGRAGFGAALPCTSCS